MIREFFARFKRAAPVLTTQQRTRLDFLTQKISSASTASLVSDRIVVVDVETSGLSLANDRLLEIGAVAIHSGRIVLADSFEVLLRQDTVSDKANILIHGIGGTAQRSGLPPAEALLDFLEYLDGAPLFAFHALFDETMLRKAYRKFLGIEFRHSWVDLADLLPEFFPQYAKEFHALDDWLTHFSIGNDTRHNALADAMATAQLSLIMLRGARVKGIVNFKSLRELERAQRWLSAARY